MEGAREARRKRIINRGSDRLAFITGEARFLPTPPPPPPPPPQQEDPQTAAASSVEDDATGFEWPKQASNQTLSNIVENDDGKELLEETSEEFPKCKLGKEFPKRGRSNEATINAENSGGSAELSTTSISRGSSDQVADTAPCTAPRMSHQIFTPSQISRSILATENIRMLCAITIALLVVLSGHGYSLGGGVVRSLINFRPLFLILLTDATLIIGWVLVTGDNKDEEEVKRSKKEENGLGKALEAGMVFQKALRAAFMDCSICAVIMISGFVV